MLPLGQCTKRFTAHFRCKDQSIRRHEDDERASTDSAQRDSAFGGMWLADCATRCARAKSGRIQKRSCGEEEFGKRSGYECAASCGAWPGTDRGRSEERRVGKGLRWWGWRERW